MEATQTELAGIIEEEHERFVAKIDRVLFTKEDWVILSVTRLDTKDRLICKGTLKNPKKGNQLEFVGKFVDYKNRKTNEVERQFSFSFAIAPRPQDDAGVLNYLKQIAGEKTAQMIVEAFPENALEVLDNEPERLRELHGIGRIRLHKIVKKHREMLGDREAILFFKQFDLTMRTILKILEGLGKDAVDKFRDNPYVLTQLSGIGFQRADEIARKTGIPYDDDKRIRAGAMYLLDQATNNGHCYLPFGVLAREMEELLKTSGENLVSAIQIHGEINQMITENVLIKHEATDEDQVYLPWIFAVEQNVARQILQFNSSPRRVDLDVAKEIAEIEAELGVKYAENQKKFFYEVLEKNFVILTGGPGTGKTTVLNGALRLLERAFPSDEILLCAPTGKAAKRMTESTGRDASTVHRALGTEGKGKFKYNEFNLLPVQIADVDEFSMMDIFMSNSFFKALDKTTKVILVGDVDQLPSVGAGAVLLDMIDSGVVPFVRLTEIFRQAQDSGIVVNAYEVNKGSFPDKPAPKNDFIYIPVKDSEECVAKIEEVVAQYSLYYDPKDIQVLTPTKQKATGVINLNKRLQYLLNEQFDQKELRISLGKDEDVVFRVGDKVMQYRNNYDLGIFNGDSGVIDDILELEDEDGGKETIVKVIVDGQTFDYAHDDLYDLRHSYAVTIHKSQGSEWPVVIIPVTFDGYSMLKRNLLYTGITRAKQICVVIGDQKAIWKCVRTLDMSTRYTNLDKWLREFAA